MLFDKKQVTDRRQTRLHQLVEEIGADGQIRFPDHAVGLRDTGKPSKGQ